MFSSKGYAKNAQALMYVHGIYFISYENSEVINKIVKRIESLLKTIKFGEIPNEYLNLRDLKMLYSLPEKFRKKNFLERLKKLEELVEATESYVGVLDRFWVIHFLTNKKLKPRLKPLKAHAFLCGENMIQLRYSPSKRGRIIGSFSLPTSFLKEYIKYSNKRNKKVLSELILYINANDYIYPLYIEIDQKSVEKLIQQLFDEMKDGRGEVG